MFNKLENLYSVFVVVLVAAIFHFGVLENFFKLPPIHMKVPKVTSKCCRPCQRDMPLVNSAVMVKCKQANKS